jgi:hypothetical protein
MTEAALFFWNRARGKSRHSNQGNQIKTLTKNPGTGPGLIANIP